MKYGLRYETSDGTLEEVYMSFTNKRRALQQAARAAKSVYSLDVVAVWVDDTTKDLGVAKFPTKNAHIR